MLKRVALFVKSSTDRQQEGKVPNAFQASYIKRQPMTGWKWIIGTIVLAMTLLASDISSASVLRYSYLNNLWYVNGWRILDLAVERPQSYV